MPEAPRTPPTPASARGPSAPPAGGERADLLGVDVSDEIASAQAAAEAAGNAIVITTPELPPFPREFGFAEADPSSSP